MSGELKVLIQWPNGTILPVLTNKSSKGIELVQLLRFAYSSSENILLYYNGMPLNMEKPLENQFIRENGIIEAFITPKISKNSEQYDPNIQSIIFEAAKIADKRYNALENQSYRIKYTEENSSDVDFYTEFYDYNQKEEEDSDKSSSIPSDPLPAFWNESSPDSAVSLSSYPSEVNLNSIEEAGQFFENKGWQPWM